MILVEDSFDVIPFSPSAKTMANVRVPSGRSGNYAVVISFYLSGTSVSQPGWRYNGSGGNVMYTSSGYVTDEATNKFMVGVSYLTGMSPVSGTVAIYKPAHSSGSGYARIRVLSGVDNAYLHEFSGSTGHADASNFGKSGGFCFGISVVGKNATFGPAGSFDSIIEQANNIGIYPGSYAAWQTVNPQWRGSDLTWGVYWGGGSVYTTVGKAVRFTNYKYDSRPMFL